MDANVDNFDNVTTAMNRMLENALYFRISDMETRVLILSIDKLIDLNNIVIGGNSVILRQRQMYTYIPAEIKV